jgi:uncharacterized membrane protein
MICLADSCMACRVKHYNGYRVIVYSCFIIGLVLLWVVTCYTFGTESDKYLTFGFSLLVCVIRLLRVEERTLKLL